MTEVFRDFSAPEPFKYIPPDVTEKSVSAFPHAVFLLFSEQIPAISFDFIYFSVFIKTQCVSSVRQKLNFMH